MADASEDSFFTSTSSRNQAQDPDSDDDDLPPDFLTLGRSSKSKDGGGGIPKRGVKDFESNTTLLQSRTLAASRNAMWDTLGVVRVHHATIFERKRVKKIISKKKRPQEGLVEDPEQLEEVEEEVLHALNSGGTPLGIYDPTTGITTVPKQHVRGSMFMRLGKDLSGGGVELLPEEALWALEGSKLDVRYPADFWDHATREIVNSEEQDDDSIGIPMSLQGAYAAYIGEEAYRGGQLTLEKYLVFAALKRLGYIVLRSPEWDGTPRLDRSGTPRLNEPETRPPQTLLQWLTTFVIPSSTSEGETLSDRTRRQQLGPLVTPGIYRSYADIFKLLQLIPSHDPLYPVARSSNVQTLPQSLDQSHSNPYTTHWNVFKPPGNTNSVQTSSTWRKSAPGEPAFRISVVSARDTVMPTLEELEALMGEQKLMPPPGISASGASDGDKKSESINATYGRLKHGYKNVILAVVDEGIVSYVRVADAGFVREKLYERVESGRGGKGGGRGGGRGRGRGRGRGGRN